MFYERVGGEVRVHDARSFDQEESSVTALSTGGYVVTWRDYRGAGNLFDGHGIRAQLFGSDGSKIGSDFLVNTSNTDHFQPSVGALSNGGFVAAWKNFAGDPSGSGVSAQIFDAAGARVGSEFRVNTTITNHQEEPVVTGLAGGGFVVSWRDRSAQSPDTSRSSVKAQIYDGAGAAVGGEFLVNSAVLNNQWTPVIAALDGGGFVATWADESGQGGDPSGFGIKAQLFGAAGARLGSEVLVNTRTEGSQTGPAVASLPTGGFVVAWNGYTQSDGIGHFDVSAQRFDASGNKIGNETLVNTVVSSDQTRPSVAALSSGGFIVSWNDNSGEGGDGSGSGIKAQAFNAAGDKENGEILVNTSTTYDQLDSSVAVLSSGAFVVTWTDGRDAEFNEVHSQLFAPAPSDGVEEVRISNSQVHEESIGGLEVARFAAVGAAEGTPLVYSLVSDGGGAFSIDGNKLLVSNPSRLNFETASSVTLRVRAVDGTQVAYEEDIAITLLDDPEQAGTYSAGPEFRVNQGTSGYQDNVTVAALASGGFVMAWSDGSWEGQGDGSGYGIKARLLDATGAAIGAEFTANTIKSGNQITPTAAGLVGGGFALAWRDASGLGGDASGDSIKAQLFDAGGAKIGGELLVNTVTLEGQQDPSITALANGGFVVSWTDASRQGADTSISAIKAQVFETSGARVGGELLVNSTLDQDQIESSVAALSGGGFVVTWTDWSFDRPDGSLNGVKAQIFSASGQRVGGEFLVNTEIDAQQRGSAVAALAGDRYVVVWWDESRQGGDTSGWGLKGQVFDGTGGKLGSEILVNTTVRGSQWHPAVEGLPDGGFFVSWTDESKQGVDSSGSAVKAQMFNAAGQKVGAEFLLSHRTLNDQTLPDTAVSAAGNILTAWSDYSLQDGDLSASAIKARVLTFTSLGGDLVGTAGDDTLVGTSENDRILAGSGNDVVFADDGDDVLLGEAGTDTLDGGAGTDTADFSTETGGGNVLVNLSSSAVSGPGGISLKPEDARDSFGSIDSLTAIENLKTGGGNDTVHGSNGDNKIETGSGNDVLYLASGGADEAFGNGGNDGFLFGAAFTSADRVDGGQDADVVAIQGDYSAGLTLGTDSLKNIETLTPLSGGDRRFGDLIGNLYSYNLTLADANVPAGGRLTINAAALAAGENLTLNGAAESDGTLFIYGGFGADLLTGGSGADVFFFAEGRLNPSDKFDGGAGADILVLRGNYTGGSALTFVSDSMLNVETVTLMSASDTRFFTGGVSYGYDVTTQDGNVGAGRTVTVNGGKLLAAERMAFDGVAETDGHFRLFGGSGNDDLQGGGGNDLIYGGVGADSLTGNGGADSFRYQSVAESTLSSHDTINGFASGTDKIDLSRIDADNRTAADDAFTFIEAQAFNGVAGEIRAYQSNGSWIVEADVDGDGSADLVIGINAAQPLSGSDFLL